jgi:hypothetical protein
MLKNARTTEICCKLRLHKIGELTIDGKLYGNIPIEEAERAATCVDLDTAEYYAQFSHKISVI